MSENIIANLIMIICVFIYITLLIYGFIKYKHDMKKWKKFEADLQDIFND